MKKILRLLPLLLIILSGVTLSACGNDDDDDEDYVISSYQLPSAARAFITQYFPSATIRYAEADNMEYEVMLSDGTRIEFNNSGHWIDVDAAAGRRVPKGFYPSAIDTYLESEVYDAGINEISVIPSGYEVELLTGIDAYFNREGAFISFDED